ncbi:hypothetical protein TrCOL_g10021 [Triparma columacea]|uniref:Fucosyltransferase n=1 Tax=Triparma columacea TaxID=722753 RepID=A0A9W7GD09_9STRA|nr:hypothetical protein TrCOL_g10021 [Triparma columacea]
MLSSSGVIGFFVYIFLSIPSVYPSSPAPLSLNVTSPLPNTVISGRTVTVAADLWITDDSVDVGEFLKGSEDMTVCMRLETESFIDIYDNSPSPANVGGEGGGGEGGGYSETVCGGLDSVGHKFTGVPFGRHTLDAWLSDGGGNVVAIQPGFAFHTTRREATGNKVTDPRSLEIISEQQTLLGWWRDGNNDLYVSSDISPPPTPINSCSKVGSSGFDSALGRTRSLVIGVKTSAKAFPHRMAIRSTWGGPSLREGGEVCLFFVVGRVDQDMPDVREVEMALRNEQHVYSDLLLWPDVDVIDSYYTLVEKTSSFISYAVRNHNFRYLMMVDDDVLLKVPDLLLGLTTRHPGGSWYAGQVWEVQYGHKIRPNRDPSNRNAVTLEEYQHEHLPKFAIGPHYLLSRSACEWIADNLGKLKTVGTLEDATIGWWMEVHGVDVEHVPMFGNARNEGCQEGLVSLADLRPHGIIRIWENLKEGRDMCKGFERDWVREGELLSGLKEGKGAELEGSSGGVGGGSGVPGTSEIFDGSDIDFKPGPTPFMVELHLHGKYLGLEVCVSGNGGSYKCEPDPSEGPSVVGEGGGEELCWKNEGAVELGPLYAGTHVFKVKVGGGEVERVVNIVENSGRVGVGMMDEEVEVEGEEEERDGEGRKLGPSHGASSSVSSRGGSPPYRVVFLFISLESHSQNNIYVKLAGYLPRSEFSVEFAGFVDVVTRERGGVGRGGGGRGGGGRGGKGGGIGGRNSGDVGKGVGDNGNSGNGNSGNKDGESNGEFNGEYSSKYKSNSKYKSKSNSKSNSKKDKKKKEDGIGNQLARMFIPCHAVYKPMGVAMGVNDNNDNNNNNDTHNASLSALLKSLTSATKWREVARPTKQLLQPIYNTLVNADVAFIANSHDNIYMLILLEITRLVKLENGRENGKENGENGNTQMFENTVTPNPKHNKELKVIMDLPNKHVYPQVYPLVDAYVAPSYYVKEEEHLKDKDVAVVYPAGLEKKIKGEEGRGEPGKMEEEVGGRKIKRVGYLGRLSPERSPGLFFEVATMVSSAVKTQGLSYDVEFIVAGDGILRSAMERYVSDLGIEDRVTFLGTIDKEGVEELLSVVDVMVNPALETFGISNVEAAGKGVPVVAWRVGGNGESLRDEEGVEIEEGVEGLVKEVIRYLEEGREKGGRGEEEIRVKFGVEKMAEGYGKVIRRHAEKGRRGRGGEGEGGIKSKGSKGKNGDSSTAATREGASLKARGAGRVVTTGTLNVAYSEGSSYIREVLFKLLPKIYTNVRVVVDHEKHVIDPGGVDIVVVSVLDGGCGSSWEERCRRYLRKLKDKFPNAKALLVSGEAWDISEAGREGADIVWAAHGRGELLPGDKRVVHVPNAATSFAERNKGRGFRELMEGGGGGREEEGRRFAAYMYSRCDRPVREEFYDILSSRASLVGATVDVLGACQGQSAGEHPSADTRRANRHKSGWHDDAVEVYRDYAFVVAFENVKEEGYFTEKLINPLLAGSVPIYWGWEGVGDIMDGVVACGEDLVECADRVVELWVGGGWKELARRGRKQREEVMLEWFGWEVGEGRVVEEIKEAFRLAGGLGGGGE